jgi:hypothetical protein
MSRTLGLIKVQSYYNRIQQKRDWQLILRTINKELPPPDFTKSVKKIDFYMEQVCKENNLNHLEIFGRG